MSPHKIQSGNYKAQIRSSNVFLNFVYSRKVNKRIDKMKCFKEEKVGYFLSLYAIIKQIHPIKIASSDFEKYLYQKKQ